MRKKVETAIIVIVSVRIRNIQRFPVAYAALPFLFISLGNEINLTLFIMVYDSTKATFTAIRRNDS